MIWDILIWIVIGAVAGILADIVVRGIRLRLVGKIIVGILGGVAGGYAWSLFTGLDLGFLGKIIAAFVGAVIFLMILRAIRGRK